MRKSTKRKWLPAAQYYGQKRVDAREVLREEASRLMLSNPQDAVHLLIKAIGLVGRHNPQLHRKIGRELIACKNRVKEFNSKELKRGSSRSATPETLLDTIAVKQRLREDYSEATSQEMTAERKS